MTELTLLDLYQGSSLTSKQNRKLINLQRAEENAQDKGFKKLWKDKWVELLFEYLKINKELPAIISS